MTLQGLIEFWRKQVSDESAPYLWDDTEALIFAIDAQDMFVRSGQGITGVMGDSPSVGPSAGISPTPGAQVGPQ